MTKQLQTTRLILRPIASKHIDPIGQAAGTTDSDRIKTLVRNSEEWWQSYGYGVWVILDAESEDCLGWCGLRPEMSPDAPELFYGLAVNAQGNGFATEAGLAVLDFVFSCGQVNAVWAATKYANTASIGVMQRIGMEFENCTDLDGVESVIYRICNTVGK